MNKKILMFALPLLAIGLVAAGIGYYAMFSATITVSPSIELLGDCTDTFNAFDGDIIEGSSCTITNNADSERELTISNDADLVKNDGIEVSYVGTLTLAQKDLTDWSYDLIDAKTITYTIVGEKFVVNDIPIGYTLIYYPNTEGDVFVTNVANVLVYDSDTIGNLPIALDVGGNYCTNGYNPDPNQCVGAKLWLIEGDETTALGKLNSWDASEFYFETDLIQYNSAGEITLSPKASLTITPVYDIEPGVNGTKTITTKIA